MTPLIVTQFAFDPDVVLSWLKALRARGLALGAARRAGERREAAAIRQATGAMAYRRVMAAHFAEQGAKAIVDARNARFARQRQQALIEARRAALAG